MSALQDSSHSREQSLDRKPAEVSQHRLVSQQFDVIANNKIKTMTPHQLLAQQNMATSVTIVSAALSAAPRVTLSSTILHQALSPRVGGYVPSTTSIMLSHSTGTIGTAAAAAKMTFQSQQQVAINLSSNASSTASATHSSSVNQTPASEQALAHQGIYGIGSTIGGRQVVPRMPLTTLVGGVELTPRSITIPKVAAISDLRMQTAPASAHGSHLPKGAIAAASILTAPKSGHMAIARPVAPSVATPIQVQPPVLGGLVIQSSTAQPAKMVMHAGRAMPPSGPRQSLPTVSIVTTSASRIPSISLQPQMPWSSATAIQVPVLPAKPQLDAGGTHVGGAPSAANILQQSIRPVAHNQQLGTQQTPPLAIRTPSSAQKVLLSSPFTSLAPASVSHLSTTAATVARVSDNASNHSVVSRPTLVPGMPLPVVSMAQGLPGGNSAALPHPVSVAQNVPPKTHKVVLSKAALPVQSISISKMGGTALPTAGMNLARPKKNIRLQSATTSVVTLPNVASVAFAPVVAKGVVPVVSVQAMTNVGIKPQTNATLPSSITAVPVAKVPPHAFTIQQLPTDGQSAATCRLVSPGGQPLSQQQQHPRSAVPPGSQIIPIQQNTVFLTSNCLSSTALPAAALSIPVTSIESRQPNEHGPVLHQVSYAIPDGARYLTPQHLMNLSSTYAGLQPLTFQASNVRPGSVTSQAPALSVSLHGSSNAGTSLSSVVGMANQAGRLNTTSVVVAMDTSRLASLTIPSNFAAGDGIRAGESALTPIGMALNQGAILQQQQPHHQPQPTVIALMQPVPPSSSATNDSVKQQTMSPRPPILRKRLHDSVVSSGAKKNLFSPVASLTNDMAGGLTVSSAAELSQLILASPKSFDVSIENSQSSTDTASSAESTPRSCLPSSTRVKDEPQDCFENGVPVRDPSLKIVPRKKPRKQSLHANEEIPDGFSSEDEDLGRTPMNICLNADFRPIDEEPEQRGMFAPADYVDDEGFRWTRARPKNLAIPKEYAWGSKPRSNHFICFSDVKLKDERRPTVNELANTAGIQQNANGAKVNRISDQFVQLIKLETNDFDRMKAIQSEFPTKISGKQVSGDDEVRSVGEIVLANVQRCQTYIDQLSEVRDLLNRLLHHKRQAYEIIAKHQSKRTVKKKERS